MYDLTFYRQQGKEPLICLGTQLYDRFGMENYAYNSSVENSSLSEFPFWQPTLAVSLLSFVLHTCIILTLYLPVLMAILKTRKDRCNPLNMIHISLLTSVITETLLQTLLQAIYLPSAHQFCTCFQQLGAIIFAINVFFSVYWAVAFACLAVLLLFVTLGKKKLVNLKIASGVIALSIGVSLLPVIEVVRLTSTNTETYLCYESHCPSSVKQANGKLYTNITIASSLGVLPLTSIIAVAVSILSCAVFNRCYSQSDGDITLDRRMLSLPIIMTFFVVVFEALKVMIRILPGNILSPLFLGDYFPNWILFTISLLLNFFDFITRVMYLLFLLYTHPHLRQTAKKLCELCKSNNRVAPEVPGPAEQQ